MDEEGRIWSSMPDGVCVLEFVPRSFPDFEAPSWRVVTEIIMGVNTSNVCFGEGKDVFITGAGHVWRAQRS